jgi:hypothetical protein
LLNTHDRGPIDAVAASFQFEACSVATVTPSESTGRAPFSAPCDPGLPSSSTVLPQPIPGAPATLSPVTR